MNEFNNTNNESAMTKQFKSNGCVGLQGSNNNDNEQTIEKKLKRHQMNLQKGADGRKFQLLFSKDDKPKAVQKLM